jgi:hypothetical protein
VDSDWIPDLFAMEIYSCTHYNYNEHYSTGSFLDPTDGTVLRRRLTSRAEHFCCRRLTDDDSLRGPTHQLPRNPGYHCWLRIHRDLLSRLLGMTKLYPGYDCEQVYNCCQKYPGYDRCLQSTTSLYLYIYIYIYIYCDAFDRGPSLPSNRGRMFP